jgi:hypothetical protein
MPESEGQEPVRTSPKTFTVLAAIGWVLGGVLVSAWAWSYFSLDGTQLDASVFQGDHVVTVNSWLCSERGVIEFGEEIDGAGAAFPLLSAIESRPEWHSEHGRPSYTRYRPALGVGYDFQYGNTHAQYTRHIWVPYWLLNSSS